MQVRIRNMGSYHIKVLDNNILLAQLITNYYSCELSLWFSYFFRTIKNCTTCTSWLFGLNAYIFPLHVCMHAYSLAQTCKKSPAASGQRSIYSSILLPPVAYQRIWEFNKQVKMAYITSLLPLHPFSWWRQLRGILLVNTEVDIAIITGNNWQTCIFHQFVQTL